VAVPYDTEALLVRSVDYGESDRIVTLLTRTQGKLGAIARGARRSKRRFAGALHRVPAFRATLWSRPRTDLALLREAELIRPFPAVPGDPVRYAHAAVATELIRELTPSGEADERPFSLLVGYLETLDGQGPSLRLLAEVVLSALTLAGVAPALERCAACGRKAPPASAARFDTLRGIVCTACGGAPLLMRGRVRAALLAATAGRDLAGTDQRDLAEGVALLLDFARGQLGRDLRSAALLAGVSFGRAG
jgi:DNA repair protein RecO (recombination protein O)